ncbi:hypothetical protein [Prosthecobacter sp.]|jgi:hypothetical protein|uniref:hypothetical protein n=1 Tax=Prosthecobacter sp. TaxID=1965333 RepID=UPI0037C693F7
MKHLLLLALLTLSARAQDTEGWKTILATPQELKDYPKEQAELVDGLLHLRAGNGIYIPQPTPDGAIRARFHFREGTGFPQLRIRRSTAAKPKDADYYNLLLYIRPGQTTVKEGIIDASMHGKGKRVGAFPLPEPFVLGAYVDLEFSTLGDHLQVLVNGKPAFQLTDTTFSTGGLWGLASQEAWFSNIQVRTFPRSPEAAATQLGKTTDPRILQLQEAYTAAIAREVTPAHLEAIQSLDTQYTAALDRALEATAQSGKLDDALALRTEKKRVEDKAPLPLADAPIADSLKPLLATYRSSLLQLTTQRDQRLLPLHEKYLQALTAYQDELTRAKNLDAALQVKTFREAEAASVKAP